MRYCKLKIFFAYKKLFFEIRIILKKKCFMRSKFFPQFVEKIEKLKLSLSKQHNKMLKMRSEMLKTEKKKQNNEVRGIFPGIF